MNFYEFYQLINENTVAQEIKKFKKENPSTAEKLLPVAYKQIKDFLPNINDKSLKTIANWILFLYFYFCKQNQIYNASIVTFNRFLSNNLTLYLYQAYLASQLDNNGNWSAILSSKFNDPKFSVYNLANLDRDYHENLKKKQRNIPGREGKTVLSFSDGYKWVDLERGYCDIEGTAMGHCGNSGAIRGDTILSLRDDKNIPHLTFILNKGMLEERKARNNSKPSPKYHNYIIELLKLSIIEGLGPGRYKPENDFKLSDLTQEQAKEVAKVNKNLEKDYLMLVVSENTWKIDDDEYGEALYEIIKKHPEILERYDLVYKITEDDKTPPEVLKILLDKKYPGASQNIQDKLTFNIKLNLIANKNTPKEVLDELATEDGTNPQHYLSMIPHYNRFIGSDKNKISSTYLNKVALYILNMLRYPKSDNDEYGFPLHILQHVAENPNTSVETLNKIIEKIELVIKADLINDRKDLLVGDRLIDRLIDNNKVPEEVKAELMKKRKEFYPK